MHAFIGLVGTAAAILLALGLTGAVHKAISGLISSESGIFSDRTVVKAIIFICLFALFALLIKLVGFFLERVVKIIPVVGALDRILGFFFGVITALFWVWVLGVLLPILLGAISGELGDIEKFIEESGLYKAVGKMNLIKTILEHMG